MIRTDHDIRHTLAHLEIGEPAVKATTQQSRFGDAALQAFFKHLRDGHRNALTEYDASLEHIIGHDEADELNHFGSFGVFAGRMAMTESGLITIEHVLHHQPAPALQQHLQASLVNAVNVLRTH